VRPVGQKTSRTLPQSEDKSVNQRWRRHIVIGARGHSLPVVEKIRRFFREDKMSAHQKKNFRKAKRRLDRLGKTESRGGKNLPSRSSRKVRCRCAGAGLENLRGAAVSTKTVSDRFTKGRSKEGERGTGIMNRGKTEGKGVR